MAPLPPLALPIQIGFAVLLVVVMLFAGWRKGVLPRAMWVSAIVVAWTAGVIWAMATYGVPPLWGVMLLLYGGMGVWGWATWPQWGPIFGFKPQRGAGRRIGRE